MALIFAESCDQATNVQTMKLRDWESSPSGAAQISTTGGKTGAGALTFVGSESNNYWLRTISQGTGKIRCAAWFKHAAAPASADRWLFRPTNFAATQMGGLKVAQTTGVVKAFPWSSGSPAAIGTGTTNVCDTQWHYIETEMLFDNAAGVFKVWIDGVLEINVSGDTFDAGTVAQDRIYVGAFNNAAFIDDILIWNDTGTDLTGNLAGKAYLMKTLRPTSDASVQFTRSSGADNYTLVDETGLDITDYVEDGTSGHIDRYGFSDTGLTAEPVKAVIVEAVASNPGVGAVSAKLLSEQGGTTDESGNIGITAPNSVYQNVFPTKPGGGAWTPADADAATFGIQVV